MVDLNEGKLLKDVRIEGRGSKGDSFIKYKGIIVFIEGAAPAIGETVDVKITKVGPSCAWAQIQKWKS